MIPFGIAKQYFAMSNRFAQRAQTERLADDESMQRQRTNQRLALGLIEHFLELVDDHVGELAAGVVAMRQRTGVVQFHRIWYRKQRPGARLHPDRLVIKRPVE